MATVTPTKDLLSIDTINQFSSTALDTVKSVGAGALAADWLGSPIGAKGGAVFGGARLLSGKALNALTSKLLKTDNPGASDDTKALAFISTFLGSYAAAWYALSNMGWSLSLYEIACLDLMSACTQMLITLAINFFKNPALKCEITTVQNDALPTQDLLPEQDKAPMQAAF